MDGRDLLIIATPLQRVHRILTTRNAKSTVALPAAWTPIGTIGN